ncbi:hypothetical protein AO262_29310 [Pseudomonas fluorescens ABAC62]|nr:hypothetical protein AO262_29310 [Pseudomonas fluorescens ABAC62]
MDGVTDNFGDIQGPVANGGTTDDTTPTFNGSGQEPGSRVTLIDNGTIIGEAVVDDSGNWTVTPDLPLGDGAHDISLVVTDPAGNASDPSDPFVVIVDTTAPATPAITSVVDSEGTSTGNLASGDITDDALPQINGTAEPGSKIVIFDNGKEIGDAIADASGNWSFTPKAPLSNGPHTLTITAVDPAGNKSTPSDAFDFEVVAGGAPAAPAINGIVDDAGAQQGNLSPGDITDDKRPTINGTGEPGATITVSVNGTSVGTTTVQPDGSWSFTPPADLAEGLNNITAVASNSAGNSSPATGDYPITVDTTAPASASGMVLTDDVGSVTGPIASGSTTDDSNPTLSGKAEANSVVIIYDKGTEIDRVTADASGNWSFTPRTPLTDGGHSFTTVVEDAAGNKGPESPAIVFDVNTSSVAISITEVTDNVGPVQDPLTNGGSTDDTTPTLTGRATPNSTVTIYDGSVKLGTVTSDASGN